MAKSSKLEKGKSSKLNKEMRKKDRTLHIQDPLRMSKDAVAKRLKRRGVIQSARGYDLEELLDMWEVNKDKRVIIDKHGNEKKAPRKPKAPDIDNMSRDQLRKMLKKYNLIDSIRGWDTETLKDILYEHLYGRGRGTGKDDLIRADPKPLPEPPNNPGNDNYAKLVRMLNNLAVSYEETFVGVFKGAWKNLDDLYYFWQRIDPAKINADKSFIPFELTVSWLPPSDYEFMGHQVDPDEFVDRLNAMFGKYFY